MQRLILLPLVVLLAYPASAAGHPGDAAKGEQSAAGAQHRKSVTDDPAAEDQYLFATELFGKKMYALAVQQYEKFLREYPRHPKAFRARLRLGEAHLRLKQYDRSTAAYEAALATQPETHFRGEALVGLGVALFSARDYRRAAEVLAEARTRVADDKTLGPVAANWLGESLFHQGRFADAVKAYEAVARWPESRYAPQALYSIGFCQLKLGQSEAAVATFRRLAEKHPSAPIAAEGLVRAGEALQRAGKHDEAEALFQGVLDRKPAPETAADAAWGLAASAFARKRYAEARTRFETVRERYPGSERAAEASLRIADCFYREGRYADAAAAYEKAAAGLQGSLGREARYWLGMARWKAGDPESAADVFRSLAAGGAKDPYAQRARLRLGELEAARGKAGAAERAYRDCVEADPESEQAAAAAYELAMLAYKDRRYDEAEQGFQRFQDSYPANDQAPVARLMQAQCRFDRGDGEGARCLLEEALAVRDGAAASLSGETRASALLLLARVQADARSFTDARTTLQRLLQEHHASPRVPDALYELGWAASEAGDESAARVAWERLAREFASHTLVPDAAFRLAEAEYAGSRYEAAAPYYRQAAEAKNAGELADKAWYKLGWCYRQLGRHEEAVTAFTRVFTAHPESELALESHLRAAEALAEQQKWAAARDQFAIVAKADATTMSAVAAGAVAESAASDLALRARLGLGRALLALAETEAGLAELRALARTGNGQTGAEAQFQIGDAYFERGDLARAVKEYLRVTLLFSAYPAWAGRAQYQIGESYRLLGRSEEAHAAYRACLQSYAGSRWAELSAQRLESEKSS